MRFSFEGSTYEISFERNRRKSETIDKGIPPSRLTTVNIYKTTPGTLPGELYRTATSAACALDNFEYEEGRIRALRLVSLTVSKEFKRAMWNAYTTRRPAKAKVETRPSNVIPFPLS